MMDAQFHAAIREADALAAAWHPPLVAVDANVPRLVYAEWLAEHGDARSAYIEVSCELANLEPPRVCFGDDDDFHNNVYHVGDTGFRCHLTEHGGPDYYKADSSHVAQVGDRVDVVQGYLTPGGKWKTRMVYGLLVRKVEHGVVNEYVLKRDAKSVKWPGESLRRRQSALLVEHAAQWFAGLPGNYRATVGGDRIETAEGDVYILRKGDIDEVQITAARFAGGVCERCNDDGNCPACGGSAEVSGAYWADDGMQRCDDCRDGVCPACDGKPNPGLAGAIGVACPVARVVKLIGAESYKINNQKWSWWGIETADQLHPMHPQSNLPTQIYELINLPEQNHETNRARLRKFKNAPTKAAANAALEAASVEFMRTEAAALERKEMAHA